MGIRQVAAQRAIGKGPSLVIPTGKSVLPKVAPQGDPAGNDHKSNSPGGPSGISHGAAKVIRAKD
jgi:hypothetical protein